MIDEALQIRIQHVAQSGEAFPVDFADAWKWVGYSTKQKAVQRLKRAFVVGVDFSTERLKSQGGRPETAFRLTKNCFKQFCMMAGTGKGREVRQYFIQCEEGLRTISAQGLDAFPEDEIVHKALHLMDGKIKRLEAANAEMRPVVLAHEILTGTGTTYSFREAAQLISRKVGFDIGQNRLVAKCINLGLIDSSRQPYQRHIDGGLLTRTLEHIPNINKNTGTTRFTNKGLDWIINRLLSESGQLPGITSAREVER